MTATLSLRGTLVRWSRQLAALLQLVPDDHLYGTGFRVASTLPPGPLTALPPAEDGTQLKS